MAFWKCTLVPFPTLKSQEIPKQPDDPDSPGVPGFRTWRGVYLFVFAVFVLIVIGLTIFTRVFA